MNKFTREAPFKFEDIKVWRPDYSGHLFIDDPKDNYGSYTVPERRIEAAASFIEAERGSQETWEWTNDDHTEARKGRWVAFACEGGSCDLEHDDLPGLTWYADESAVPASIAGVRESYQAWKSAQNQPREPAASKFGYVGTKDDKDVFRSENGTYGLVSRETGNWIEGLTWSEVCKFDGEFKEVPRG